MRSRVWLGALLTLVAAALLLPTAAVAGNKPADTVFKNGYVYTVNPGARVAQAVAVRHGKIVYVGSNQGANAFVGPSTKVVKLGGKMVLPGFIDSHMHASMTVSSLYSVLLYGMTTVDEYVAAVADFAAAHPDMDVIRGQGWSNTVVPGIGPLASRPRRGRERQAGLHHVRGRPLLLGEQRGARARRHHRQRRRTRRTASSSASPGPRLRDPPYGTPSGTLRETAANLVTDLLPDYTVPQYKDGVSYFQEDVAAPLGLTTVFDPLMYTSAATASRRSRRWPRTAI